MNEEQLFELIGHTEESYLEECEKHRKKRFRTPKWFDVAVYIAIIYIIVMPLINVAAILFSPDYRSKGTGILGTDGAPYGYIYEGPVFPMTTVSKNDDIAVSRNIAMDFSKYLSTGYESEMLLNDTYTFTNTSDENMTFDICYPFVISDLSNKLERCLPKITLDGNTVEDAALYVGNYIDELNQSDENSFKSYVDYQSLVSDGSLLKNALTQNIDLSDIPVIEYSISNKILLDELSIFYVECDRNPDKTKYLLGDNFYYYNKSEDGASQFGFAGLYAFQSSAKLIIIGDDIENIRFKNEAGVLYDSSNFEITRTEKTLDSIITEYALKDARLPINYDDYYRLCCEYVYFCVMNDSDEEHSEINLQLDDLNSSIAKYTTVICYISCPITVNAKESVNVNVESVKCGSFSSHFRKIKSSGYDFLTKAGSNFEFTDVSSTIKNYKDINIVNQNFGFNLKKNIDTVSLDSENEYYYIVVEDKKAGKAYNKPWYYWWTLHLH